MLYYLVTVLYILACFTMMLVVYLQQGKGGDIASAFGGGGSSQSAFGARSGATVLSRATTICAILFMVGALALGIIGRSGPALCDRRPRAADAAVYAGHHDTRETTCDTGTGDTSTGDTSTGNAGTD